MIRKANTWDEFLVLLDGEGGFGPLIGMAIEKRKTKSKN